MPTHVQHKAVGLSVYRCVAAGVKPTTTVRERCDGARVRCNPSYPLPLGHQNGKSRAQRCRTTEWKWFTAKSWSRPADEKESGQSVMYRLHPSGANGTRPRLRPSRENRLLNVVLPVLWLLKSTMELPESGHWSCGHWASAHLSAASACNAAAAIPAATTHASQIADARPEPAQRQTLARPCIPGTGFLLSTGTDITRWGRKMGRCGCMVWV